MITSDPGAAHPEESAGVVHFGFRLVDPNDIDEAVEEVAVAGGRLLRRGEHAGFPFACVSDGYGIKIWFG